MTTTLIATNTLDHDALWSEKVSSGAPSFAVIGARGRSAIYSANSPEQAAEFALRFVGLVAKKVIERGVIA